MNATGDRCSLPSALLEALADFSEFESIDSTNAEALRQIQAGKTGTRAFLALSQTAGRGRRGRAWQSPVGAGIYLSLSRPFGAAMRELQGLSLVTALSVRQALQACGANDLQLKWPNDLLANKKKLAGILLELKQCRDESYVVFGIGINLALPPAVLREIGQPATDLQTLIGGAVERTTVVTEVLTGLLANLQRFEQTGFQGFRDDWNRHDCYYNEDIVLQEGEHRHIGKSLGVDTSGALMLQTAEGLITISGGEIFPSLRPVKPGTLS